MNDTDQDTDENKFTDTLKRMLKTPPKPHDSDTEYSNDGAKSRPPVNDKG